MPIAEDGVTGQIIHSVTTERGSWVTNWQPVALVSIQRPQTSRGSGLRRRLCMA
jgi:hypothetical protein